MPQHFLFFLAPHKWSLASAGLLLIACLYGAFGRPTPDAYGLVEYALGALLLALCAPQAVKEFTNLKPTLGHIFVLWGCAVPLAIGCALGYALEAILRDLIPFLFMALPVLFFSQLRDPSFRLSILIAVLIVGILFAVRSIWHPYFLGENDNFDYLANMPSVLATAIFLGGLAVERFYRSYGLFNLAQVLGLIVLSLLCLWPVAGSLQRASLGVYCLSLLSVFACGFYYRPSRGLVLACISGLALAFFHEDVFAAFLKLAHKQEAVGTNLRFDELSAVWQAVNQNVMSTLFGLGWGAHFNSPTVGGLSVQFTHSLVSAFLLKAGLAGCLMLALYLGFIAKLVLKV